MCGIAGFLGRPGAEDPITIVNDLVRAQAHRGPDGEGVVAFRLGGPIRRVTSRGTGGARAIEAEGGTPSAVVGSCRLAILDRSTAGDQPIVSDDGACAIVFNGEIYNYRELRSELEAGGERFRSQGDTEVLLAAYRRWGRACLDRLNGMFAFVILDRDRRTAFLARDPFGIKPLYYCASRGRMILASEIAPLLETGMASRAVNAQALYDYLALGVVDISSQTMFRDVVALAPGHFLEIDLHDVSAADPVPYWRPEMVSTADIGFPEAVRRFRQLFLESVELHLRSDVPVGALLSGGLDSSSVVMAMREVGGSGLDIHTFSYIGEYGARSEERWIDAVNSSAETVAHKVRLHPEEWAGRGPALARSLDEPFGSLAVYGQSELYRAARGAGIPVVMSGTGSDEMLGGYGAYRSALIATRIRELKLITAVREAMSMSRGVLDAVRMLALALQLTAPGWALPRGRKAWISRTWTASVLPRRRPLSLQGTDLVRDLCSRRLQLGLPDLLRFDDRNSMVSSVESRTPFLTRPLAEFVLALPGEYLISSDGRGKRLLREAMIGVLPEAVLARRERMGFEMPAESWMRESPEFAQLLAAARSIPALDSARLHDLLVALESDRALSLREVGLAWRLAGLSQWASVWRPRPWQRSAK